MINWISNRFKSKEDIEKKVEESGLKLLLNDKEYYQNMLDRQEDIQNLVCHALGDTHIPIGNFECFDEHSMIMNGIEDIKDVKKISEIFSDMGYQTAIFSKEDKNVIVLADEEHNQSFNKATHYLFENNYKFENIFNFHKKTIDFKSKFDSFCNSKQSKQQDLER